MASNMASGVTWQQRFEPCDVLNVFDQHFRKTFSHHFGSISQPFRMPNIQVFCTEVGPSARAHISDGSWITAVSATFGQTEGSGAVASAFVGCLRQPAYGK